MAKASISMPDDVYEDLQERILLMKANKSLPDKRMRSKVIVAAVEDMLDEIDDYDAWAERHGLKPGVEEDDRAAGNDFLAAD